MKVFTGFLIMAFFTLPSFGAPKAELWAHWQAHDPQSTAVIDHGLWDAFLKTYVTIDSTGLSRVDYAGVEIEDRQKLQRYVSLLQATRISTHNRDEQMAYWINFYNALTIQVVLDHMPVDSITDIDISPGFFSNGPWGAKLARVEGEDLSLNDIEHRILRPIWNDRRVHYAVNCASIGCPNLAPDAFTGERLEEMLDQAARDFINHPRGARFDGNKLVVSSIFTWYQVDFGDSDAGVVAHLREFAEGDLARRLAEYGGGLSDEYNWNLNATE